MTDSRTSRIRIAEKYAQQNREAAEIILADAARYGGEESLMCRWARLVLGRDQDRDHGRDRDQTQRRRLAA